MEWMYNSGRSGGRDITHFGSSSDKRCFTLDGAKEVVADILGCKYKDVNLIKYSGSSSGYTARARNATNAFMHVNTSLIELVRLTPRYNNGAKSSWVIKDYQFKNRAIKFLECKDLHDALDWFGNYFHYKHRVISILDRKKRPGSFSNIVEIIIGVCNDVSPRSGTRGFKLMIASNVQCVRREGMWFCYANTRDREVSPDRMIYIDGPGIYKLQREDEFNEETFSSSFPIDIFTRYGLSPHVAPAGYDPHNDFRNAYNGIRSNDMESLRNVYTNPFQLSNDRSSAYVPCPDHLRYNVGIDGGVMDGQ